MKNILALALTLICAFGLMGCSGAEAGQAAVYSFHGSNGQISVSNGTIVLSEAEEVFDGGNLEVYQSDVAQGIASFSATFYTMLDGERDVIMSNSVIDETGGSLSMPKNLGSVSGDGIILGYKIESADDLKDNLWFELSTTNIDGATKTYQLQLTLAEVSGRSSRFANPIRRNEARLTAG